MLSVQLVSTIFILHFQTNFAAVVQTIIERPQNVTVIEGESAILNCRAGEKVGSASWEIPHGGYWTEQTGSMVAKNGSNYRIIGDQAKKDYSLKILHAGFQDYGQYVCTLSRSQSVAYVRETAYVTVLLRPTKPTITTKSAYVNVGKRSKITCSSRNGNPTPSISWYLSNHQLITNRGRISITNRTLTNSTVPFLSSAQSTLSILPQKSDNGLEVYCEVTSAALKKPLVEKHLFNVHYKPKVSLSFLPSLLMIGDNVTLVCNVDSNPPPNAFKWFQGDDLLPFNTQSIVLTKGIKEDDRNKAYSCEAANLVGRSEGNTRLLLAEPPKFVKVASDYLIKHLDNVSLECQARGKPEPIITWHNANLPARIIATGNVLKFPSVDYSHAGNYQCRATSPGFAPISSVASIKVFGPPRMDVIQSTEADLGDQAKIDCYIANTPVPPSRAFWKHNQHQVANTPNSNIKVIREETKLQVTLTLIIQKVRKENYGLYNCSAWNEAGGTSKVVFLVASSSPKLPFIFIICIASALIVLVLIISSTTACIIKACRPKKNYDRKHLCNIDPLEPNPNYEIVDRFMPSQQGVPPPIRMMSKTSLHSDKNDTSYQTWDDSSSHVGSQRSFYGGRDLMPRSTTVDLGSCMNNPERSQPEGESASSVGQDSPRGLEDAETLVRLAKYYRGATELQADFPDAAPQFISNTMEYAKRRKLRSSNPDVNGSPASQTRTMSVDDMVAYPVDCNMKRSISTFKPEVFEEEEKDVPAIHGLQKFYTQPSQRALAAASSARPATMYVNQEKAMESAYRRDSSDLGDLRQNGVGRKSSRRAVQNPYNNLLKNKVRFSDQTDADAEDSDFSDATSSVFSSHYSASVVPPYTENPSDLATMV